MPDDPLDMPVKFVKGVGPVRAEQLESLGVRTAGDLIEHLPFRYELAPQSKPLGQVVLNETATVVGTIQRVRFSGGYRRSSVVADVVDGTGRCRARWFNSPYLRDTLAVGQTIRLTGKVDADERQALMVNPSFRIIPEGEDPLADDKDTYHPVYSSTAALPSGHIAGMIRALLEKTAESIVDFVPARLRAKRSLPPRRSAIARAHRPTSLDDVPLARRRLAYDEFLLLQVAIQLRRRRARQARNAPQITTTPKIDERIRARLPFKMTAAQDRAARQIAADLDSDCPMARLLQGDVGAGKTAVAVYAALATVANRHQVAMLSPTEILAQQTYARFSAYLAGSRVHLELLVGGLARAKREGILARLAAGEVDIVVGTHALIEKDVRFRSLALVIVDEQHRFGVTQRRDIRAKGRWPHYLVMTATPIPRTLAMTVYGDLDVTVIDELPPGRRAVETRLVGPQDAAQAWAFVRQRLAAGERAYVVYPLVEESESLDLKAAAAQVEELQRQALSGFKLGLLHGRMSGEQKAQIVEAFRAGRIHALVATTVVEVGVDVPEATVMVIEHAERYGLAQLHQLRGRIGRGTRQSYCLLLSDLAGEKSRQRLAVLCSTTDGFRIAEADLSMRGPGELVGSRQHGLPVFKAADLVNDFDLLVQARDDATDLLRSDPTLSAPQHQLLRRAATQKHPHLAGSANDG